jgi:hypothetical protein
LKRKEYKVDDCAEKAAHFFIACHTDPATKVKVTEAMQVRGYSNGEAADLTLQMQVHCAIQKIKGEVSLCPMAAAAPYRTPAKHATHPITMAAQTPC